MQYNFRKFIIFWLSQTVSQLGSAMTSFALVVWAFTKTGSTLSVSLMLFCSYVPYVMVSLFSGGFVDSHNKKTIMLVSDAVAALCSIAAVLLFMFGSLEIYHIYIINFIIGAMNAFQSPAQSVVIGVLVPEEKRAKASGMDSFSTNLVTVTAPMIAAAIYASLGLGAVLIIDLATFIFAEFVLLFFIEIKEKTEKKAEKAKPFQGCIEGFAFLKGQRGLMNIILTMSLINFFSRLTYENILSPMILARSGGDTIVLSVVTAVLGVGGIAGGLLVTLNKRPYRCVDIIYLCAAASFLLGDIVMGLGRNVWAWCAAGLFASVPAPFIMAGQRVILYDIVPHEKQGRVFSVRNAMQFALIPVGILLGGVLAENVFEPLMSNGSQIAALLSALVGNGEGSGMGVMFLCTGICGCIVSLAGYFNKNVRSFREYKLTNTKNTQKATQ